MMIKVALGKDLGVAKTKEIEWSKFSAALTKHEQSNRKGGKFFVGGYFQGDERKEDSMVARTLLTIDCDEIGLSIDDLEGRMIWYLDFAYAAYSTYSHTPDQPRIRLVAPLSREVSPDEYRTLSRRFGEKFGEWFNLQLDECSYKPNQVMYMPTCPDTSSAWTCSGEGKPLNVDAYLTLEDSPAKDVTADDLEALIEDEPLDLTDDEVKGWLAAYPASGTDYSQWVMVGAALHHQYRGDVFGKKIWFDWSADDAERFDRAAINTKWKSFGRSSRKATFASVIYLVKEAGGFDAPEATGALQVLLDEAEAIETIDQYNEYKEKLAKIPAIALQDDHRAMISARIAKNFGKEHGVGKGDIKKAITPSKRQRGVDSTVDTPEWLESWVYCESTLEFINIDLDYAIKREGFNAKYDREAECIVSEMSASQYALTRAQIQTVVDVMFWPGADQMFDHEGKLMLNLYRNHGVTPVPYSAISPVVDRFMRHLAWTVADEGDRTILLDWLCFVCQNPGLRINWALLLQGAQGTGKTYLVNVLQAVLGRNVSSLDPQAIAGRFTGWAHGSTVTAIEEIRIHGTNKYEILDRMKPFLTNAVVAIEEKGRDHRTVPNFTSYLLLTNHRDAIPLADGDRRYCVIYSRWQSERDMYRDLGGREAAEAYFDELFDDLHESRVGELAHFLKTRKLSSGFSPRGRAPETTARQAMINLAISPEREMLEDAIAEHECAVINENVLDITYLNQLCQMEGTELPKTRAVSAILLEMGYVQYEKRRVKISKNRKYHYVWVGRNSDHDIAPQQVKGFHDDPDFIPF